MPLPMPFLTILFDNRQWSSRPSVVVGHTHQGIEGIDNGPVPSSWHDCLVVVVVVLAN
jgi:hypothetical protein